MGILSSIKDRFKRKEPMPSDVTKPEIPKPTGLEVSPLEKTTAENVRAKMDLVMTQLDSLRTQYETLNERIKNIEKLVMEIRSYCK